MMKFFAWLVHGSKPDRRMLCHECADRLQNRWAFARLLHLIRGEHTCEECGARFSVESAV